jgi:REP element-mobilizing transposase RayT
MASASQGCLVFRSWGGRRAGAGRPPAPGRRVVPHRRRAPHDRHVPVHVTFRAVSEIPSLRGDRIFAAVGDALAAASGQRSRLLHWSVQADHIHLLIEADSGASLVRGCQGLAVRVAKAVNRTPGRRGAVWGDRYHVRPLRTPPGAFGCGGGTFLLRLRHDQSFVSPRGTAQDARAGTGALGSPHATFGECRCRNTRRPARRPTVNRDVAGGLDTRVLARNWHASSCTRPGAGRSRRTNRPISGHARSVRPPSRPSRCGDSACTPGGAWRRRRRARGRAGGSDATRASSCCSRDSRGARPSAACRRPHMRAP